MDKNILLNSATILNHIRSGIGISSYDDGNYTLLYYNLGFERLIGYTKSELEKEYNNSYEPLILTEDKIDSDKSLIEQFKVGNHYTIQYRLKKKSNEIIWILEEGVLITLDNGTKYLQYLVMDLTKEKLLEKSFKEKSIYLETITNNLQAAIVNCSHDNKLLISYASHGFYRLTGYTKQQFEEEKQNSLASITHPDDLKLKNKSIEKQFEEDSTLENTYRLICRDGRIAWILEKGTIYKNNYNEFDFHGVLMDITKQKSVEEELILNKQKYEIALGFAKIEMFEYNTSTKIMIFDKKNTQTYGLPLVLPNAVEAIIDRGIIHSFSIDAFRELYKKVDNGQPYAKETIRVIEPQSQNEAIVELSLTNIFDDHGMSITVVGVRRDITETMNMEREQKFSNVINYNQSLTYEANITKDTILSFDEIWAKSQHVNKELSFSANIDNLAKKAIHPDDAKDFKAHFEQSFLEESFKLKKTLLVTEYRQKINSNNYRWCKSKQNLIMDNFNELILRCYITDIHVKKIKELKAQEEKLIYENMILKSTSYYHINFKKNLLLKGNEKWRETFGIKPTGDYTQMMDAFVKKAIHPDDKKLFKNMFFLRNVIKSFEKEQTNLTCDYRRLNEDGNYNWMRCSLHLFEDVHTSELKGHSFVSNIHDEKLREQALIFKAEHDSLTELNNKITLEKSITEFLKTSEGRLKNHAFIIIDLDFFKQVNDNFGHAFGDVILTQTANKISGFFREEDILGRIGGDEFVAFMKNIPSQDIVLEKAEQVCASIKEKLIKRINNQNQELQISASLGIAFYKEHGKTYQELYRNSDSALYHSKENGKNRYTVYSDSMTFNHTVIKEIDEYPLKEL